VTRLFSLVLLLALPAFAEEPASTVTLRPEAPPRLLGLSATTASAFSLATSIGAGAIALGTQSACTQAYGQPRPLCAAGGVLLGGAVQLALSALIIPELFRISGLDPGAIRAGWWQWARWPAAALAISALVLLAGSAAEQDRYGSAQGTMIGGLAGTAATGLSIDVFGVIGAVRAAQGKR
jgi:hypothetical protein